MGKRSQEQILFYPEVFLYSVGKGLDPVSFFGCYLFQFFPGTCRGCEEMGCGGELLLFGFEVEISCHHELCLLSVQQGKEVEVDRFLLGFAILRVGSSYSPVWLSYQLAVPPDLF